MPGAYYLWEIQRVRIKMQDTSGEQIAGRAWEEVSPGVYETPEPQQDYAAATVSKFTRLIYITIPTYYYIYTAGAVHTA
jgi:hypothetical protein